MSEDRLIEKYLDLWKVRTGLIATLRIDNNKPPRSHQDEMKLHAYFDDTEEAILSAEIELRLAKKFDAARIARKLAGL